MCLQVDTSDADTGSSLEITWNHSWTLLKHYTCGFFTQLHICLFVVLDVWQAKFKQQIEMANSKGAVSAQERIVDDVKSADFPVLPCERKVSAVL